MDAFLDFLPSFLANFPSLDLRFEHFHDSVMKNIGGGRRIGNARRRKTAWKQLHGREGWVTG